GSPSSWGAVLRLRRLLVERSVTIVHSHSPMLAVLARIATRTIRRRSRPVLVTTQHSPLAHYRWATRTAERMTIGLDDAHLAVSEAVRDSLPRSTRLRAI